MDRMEQMVTQRPELEILRRAQDRAVHREGVPTFVTLVDERSGIAIPVGDTASESDARPAGRQHPKCVPLQPARVGFVDSWPLFGEPIDHRYAGRQEKGPTGVDPVTGTDRPAEPGLDLQRKPLVGQFTFNGKNVYVIANHFNSKLGGSERRRSLPIPHPILDGPAGRAGPDGARLRRPNPGDRQEGERGGGRGPQRLSVQPCTEVAHHRLPPTVPGRGSSPT